MNTAPPGLTVILLATVLLAAPAQAQSVPVTKSGSELAFAALGHTLLFPLPDWLTTDEQAAADPLPLLESTSSDDGKEAAVEFVPKGQSFSDWQMHYAAHVILTPERQLEALRQELMLEMSVGCKSEVTAFFQFSEDVAGAPPPLGFACGAFLDTIEGLEGKGEVAIIAFRRTEKGLATVTQEWRGPAFDPAAPATWPVATTLVQDRAKLLNDTVQLLVAE